MINKEKLDQQKLESDKIELDQQTNSTANRIYETINNLSQSFSHNASIELQEKAKIIHHVPSH